MPTITDWLMVVITAIYVVATFLIFLSNNKSAQATQDQVNASVKQVQRATDLQLFDRRVDLLKQFEDANAFSEHEILLEILFSSSLVSIEEEVINLHKKRTRSMSYFNNLSRSIYTFNDDDENTELGNANESIEELRGHISTIKEDACSYITNSGRPIFDPEKFQTMEQEAIYYTGEICRRRDEFFDVAKDFIKQTIQQ